MLRYSLCPRPWECARHVEVLQPQCRHGQGVVSPLFWQRACTQQQPAATGTPAVKDGQIDAADLAAQADFTTCTCTHTHDPNFICNLNMGTHTCMKIPGLFVAGQCTKVKVKGQGKQCILSMNCLDTFSKFHIIGSLHTRTFEVRCTGDVDKSHVAPRPPLGRQGPGDAQSACHRVQP